MTIASFRKKLNLHGFKLVSGRGDLDRDRFAVVKVSTNEIVAGFGISGCRFTVEDAERWLAEQLAVPA